MKTIQERMAEIKAAQEAGTYTRCPRCGEKIHVEPDYDEEIPVAKLADKDPDEE